jgi:hypothetical protein
VRGRPGHPPHERADIVVRAPNVAIRRVELEGGIIINRAGSTCGTGLVVEDTTIEPLAGQPYTSDGGAVIGSRGYTARRVKSGSAGRASERPTAARS